MWSPKLYYFEFVLSLFRNFAPCMHDLVVRTIDDVI